METLKKGRRLVGENGGLYEIESLISQGTGQGDIYRAHNAKKERFAIKLFHKGDTVALRKQIERLIRRGQACEAFVTPIEIVQADGRTGYAMELVGKEYISAAALFNGVEENGRRVALDWSIKLVLLAKIADALAVLANADLGVMDVKFDNIKIDIENLRVRILDTDTIVYAKDKSVVLGTVGFMPPLTMTGKEKPNRYNDAYAVAVLIFMSLIGIHPLDGKRRNQPCNEHIDTYLFGTHPVYVFHPTDASNRPIPSDGLGRQQQCAIDKMKKYPDYFKKAMERTFVDGLFQGEKRVAIAEWSEILERLYLDGFICENCGEEHFLDTNAKECNACQKPLEKPVYLRGERGLPLFNGLIVYSDDLLVTANRYELFKVVTTKFDGRFGLECLTGNTVTLRLKNGEERVFARGDIFPIFLDSEIEVENKIFNFM